MSDVGIFDSSRILPDSARVSPRGTHEPGTGPRGVRKKLNAASHTSAADSCGGTKARNAREKSVLAPWPLSFPARAPGAMTSACRAAGASSRRAAVWLLTLAHYGGGEPSRRS